jgi:hypothetical protein
MSLKIDPITGPGPFHYLIIWIGLTIMTLWFVSYFYQINARGTIGAMFFWAGVVILIREFVPWGEVPK